MKEDRVRRVTAALLSFQVGDRVTMIDGGADTLAIPEFVGKSGVVTQVSLFGQGGCFSVKFDDRQYSLSVMAQNLIWESS